MENILITGGAGYIGSHIALELLKAKFNVSVIDNLSNGRIENISHLLDNKNFKFYNIFINHFLDVLIFQ